MKLPLLCNRATRCPTVPFLALDSRASFVFSGTRKSFRHYGLYAREGSRLRARPARQSQDQGAGLVAQVLPHAFASSHAVRSCHAAAAAQPDVMILSLSFFDLAVIMHHAWRSGRRVSSRTRLATSGERAFRYIFLSQVLHQPRGCSASRLSPRSAGTLFACITCH